MDNPVSASVDGKNEGIPDEGTDFVNKPTVGMTFLSEQKAFEYYNQYGRTMGFSIRRETCHRSKDDANITVSRRFVCSKEGVRRMDKRDKNVFKPRAETRTNCLARMGIVRLPNGHYECRYFDDKHNHEMHTSNTTHFMRSQRAISDIDAITIDLADGSGIKLKSAFDYLGMQVGGTENIGFITQDLQNYLRTKRERDLEYGDAGALGEYLGAQARDNPSFTYSMQPLAIFAGFNHHRGVVIFGAALLYDETTASIKWLFERFLEAHRQKKPITIFIDQDPAMAAALSEVLPDTWHGLCTWHMMQNGLSHHGNLMKDGSSFLKELKRCIYEYTNELEFETAWTKFREQYPSEKSTWLDKIYGIKEKWARCYMKNTFTLGVRSTQISESLNADMKDYLGVRMDVLRFFKQFERVVNAKRDNELKEDFEARDKLPRNLGCKSPILTQVGKVYTPYAYGIFLEECSWVYCCYIKSSKETDLFSKYVIGFVNEEGMDQNREYIVSYTVSERSIECSCKKFESMGIICCHALRVLQQLHINELPGRYILRRWTKAARNLVVEDSMGKRVVEDVRSDFTRRFRFAMSLYVPIVSKACYSIQGFDAIVSNAKLLASQVDDLGIDEPTDEAPAQCVDNNRGLTLKKKDGKSGKRSKSWSEKGRKKRGKGPKQTTVQVSQSTTMCTVPNPLQESQQQQQQPQQNYRWNATQATQEDQQHLTQPSIMWNASYAAQEGQQHFTRSQLMFNAPFATQEGQQHLTRSQFMFNAPFAAQEGQQHLTQPQLMWNAPILLKTVMYHF